MPLRKYMLASAALAIHLTAGGGSVSAASHGLVAHYYENASLSGDPIVTTVIENLDFSTGGSPAPGVPRDFSARWSGELLPPESATYTFTAVSDDGVRLWLDGALVIDAWSGNAPTEFSGEFDLEAGVRIPIVVEYFDDHGGATLRLGWRTPAMDHEIIPTSALFTDNPYRLEEVAPLPSPTGLSVDAIRSSKVMPVSFECEHAPGAEVQVFGILGTAAAHAVNAVQTSLSASADDRFRWIVVVAHADGEFAFRIIRWIPTVIDRGGSMVLRTGDALLLQARRGGTISIDQACGVGERITGVRPGELIAHRFEVPGYYEVRLTGRRGRQGGILEVTVVESPFFDGPTAIEVEHPRRYSVSLEAGASEVDISANDPALIEISHVHSMDDGRLEYLAKPKTIGPAKVVARVASTGALIDIQEVDAYTLTPDWVQGFLYERDEDGFGHASLGFTMSPPIRYASIRVDAYVSGFTIDGASSVTVDGEELDEAGHWSAPVVLRPNRRHTCHRLTVIAP